MALPIVRNIRVFTLDPDYITVEWEIEPTQLDLTQYTVEVWRSESEGGEYRRVSLTMVASDIFDFQDRAVNLLSKWRQFYYRIRITNRNDSSEFLDHGSNEWRKVLEGEDAGGVVMEAPPDKYALESIRRFNLVLREFGGRRVLVSVSKTWGQRCPQCWDHLKNRRKKSHCLSCFDTGITGGFFNPMEAWAMKPPHRAYVQLSQIFELQADDRVMWIPRYPRVKPRDVITTIDGDRFRVLSIARSEKAWSLTRQTVHVRRLSRDQVEYKIPIGKKDWEKDNLTVGALREHIRSTDIDSFWAAAQNMNVASEDLYEQRSDFATQQESSNAPHE
jgi:hypothetical protein